MDKVLTVVNHADAGFDLAEFALDLGWQPDASHVVLQSERGHMNAKLTRLLPVDRWYVSLIDRRTGQRTDITPPGVADTSFDVWWPAP